MLKQLWTDGPTIYYPAFTGSPYPYGGEYIVVDKFTPQEQGWIVMQRFCAHCGNTWREDGNGQCKSCGSRQIV
jgi:hypothetical protein